MGLNERGNPDMLVMFSDKHGALRVVTLASNFNSGKTRFLKAMGLNGVCSEWCGGDTPFPFPKPWGVNQHGVTIQVTRQNLDGSRHTHHATQLSASSHGALNLPYILFGLGDSCYLIEAVSFGFPLFPLIPFIPLSASSSSSAADSSDTSGAVVALPAGLHFLTWLGAIPNSQLVASPTSPDDPRSWTLNALVHPSQGVIYVAGALLVTLAVLAASIGVLQRREAVLDEREKLLTAHAFL